MYAHYFRRMKGPGFELALTETPALNTGWIESVPVSGKREARRIAKERGATPHNF